MKIVNKIIFVLFGLIVALGLSMLQVQAASEDTVTEDEFKEYYFYQTFTTVEGYEFVVNYSRSYNAQIFLTEDWPYPSYINDEGELERFNTGFLVGNTTRDDIKYTSKFIFYVTDAHGFEIVPGSMSIDTNIPIFSTFEALENYVSTGDDSGWINKPEPEEFSYFSLSGFQYDDSISASWSGIFTDLQLIKDHISDVEVVVSPSFFLILEPGEKYEEFKEPESLVIPLSGEFNKSYASFFENNPYKGRALLTLSFYPRYYDSATGCMYRGDSIFVRFDAKGKITDVDLPESSLTPIYDPGCYFDSPTSSTVIDSVGLQKTFFRWNKVVTSYLYKSNYIAVDLGYDGKWYSYSTDDFFTDNSISFSWRQAEALLKDYIEDGAFAFPDVLKGYKIRYTPYYKTSSGVYYGKPIIVSVSGNATTESITEINGDFLDDQQRYEFVDKTPTDWFEDSTLWDNVDLIVDNIKDDIDGTVDLDNLSLNFFKMLKNVISACGQFPSLVATVFSFLPADISKLLVISLSLIIILRILGR